MGSVVHLAKRLKDGDERAVIVRTNMRGRDNMPRAIAGLALYAGVR